MFLRVRCGTIVQYLLVPPHSQGKLFPLVLLTLESMCSTHTPHIGEYVFNLFQLVLLLLSLDYTIFLLLSFLHWSTHWTLVLLLVKGRVQLMNNPPNPHVGVHIQHIILLLTLLEYAFEYSSSSRWSISSNPCAMVDCYFQIETPCHPPRVGVHAQLLIFSYDLEQW